MRDAHDRVQAAPVHREAGQSGGPGRVGDVLGRGLDVERRDLDARRHDVLRREVGEVQRPYEQLGGVRLQRALLGGVAGERYELARAARGGQLLGGLQPHPVQDAVGGVVEVPDQRPEDGAEGALRPRDPPGDRQRPGDRPVLRHQLADHHEDHRGEHGAQDERGGRGGGGRQAGRLHRAGEQRGDGRLGDHADDQAGDGDAELRAGELEGEAAHGLQRAFGLAVAPLGRPLQLAALHRGQGELGRHEDRAREGEQQGDHQEDHFGHRFTSVP